MSSSPRHQPGPGRQEKPPAILESSMAVSFPLASCCCAPETKEGPTESTVSEAYSRLAHSSIAEYQASAQRKGLLQCKLLLGLAKLMRRAQQDSWDVQTTSPTGYRTRSLAPLLVVQVGVFPEICPPVLFYMCGLQKRAPRSLFHKWERIGGCPSLGPGEFIGGECFNKVQEVGSPGLG